MKLKTQIIILVITVTIIKSVESKMTIDQIKNTLKPFKNSCIKKISIDPALPEGTKNGEFPPERSLMCFMRCVLQMMKIMKNGEIQLTSIMQQIDVMMPDEYVDQIKEMCTRCHEIASQHEDTCESAFHFVKCFYESDKELYFFP